jgi:DNA-binding transcriptional ArsR family regulator
MTSEAGPAHVFVQRADLLKFPFYSDPQLSMSIPEHTYPWDRSVALFVHPVKVAILESMAWLEIPLSAKTLDEIFDRRFGVSLVSYHLKVLAEKGLVKKAGQRHVRGAQQTFYRLPAARNSGQPS